MRPTAQVTPRSKPSPFGSDVNQAAILLTLAFMVLTWSPPTPAAVLDQKAPGLQPTSSFLAETDQSDEQREASSKVKAGPATISAPDSLNRPSPPAPSHAPAPNSFPSPHQPPSLPP